MSGRLRCAIVGCGGIAQVHARALSSMEEADLIAFADIKPQRAEAMAEKFGGPTAPLRSSLTESR